MSITYKRGQCCVGSDCLHPTLELRPCHKCIKCHNIVHTLCAEIDPDTDEYKCKKCQDESENPDSSSTDTESDNSSEKIKDDDKSVMKTMTVSVEPMVEEFTTITESFTDKSVKLIPKDYFITKGQRVNSEMKKLDPEWEDLKAKVNEMINSELKEEMVVEAQRIKLKYVEKNHKVLVQNFREIGKSWKTDGSIENARKINQVTYGVFDTEKNVGYEYYLERSIMKELNLEYQDSKKGKGCVASMISRRKTDLAKCIMKRSELTHQTKITKKRTHEQTQNEGLRNKKAKFAFQIKGNEGNQWYNTDGSLYSEEFIQEDESVKEIKLKETIKALELKLAQSKKVHCNSYFLFTIFCFHLTPNFQLPIIVIA